MPEVVATGIRFPEGPVWCPDATLVVTSVADGTLVRVDVRTGAVSPVAVVGGGANAAQLASDGGFVVTQNGGIDFGAAGLFDDPPPYRPVTPGIQRVDADGMVTWLADDGFLAPNDLVVATDGTLYFTDPPHYPPPPEPAGRVHALAPDGSTHVVATGFQYCNGIALAPDGGIVVVEGLGLQRVHPDGSSEWIVARLGGAPGDGFCFDVDGRIYVALSSAHAVAVLEADGTEVERLPLDGKGITTNCCFGGSDGRTLFATDGLPGRVVAWEGMPAPGLPLHPWPAP